MEIWSARMKTPFPSLILLQTVRRLALSALNSAARNKPQLIREHLATLLPNLYNETVKNPALVRTVQMGPWTHTVDDGLEARKTAYETMYTLVWLKFSRNSKTDQMPSWTRVFQNSICMNLLVVSS